MLAALKPFRKDDHGNFWTSDEVSSTHVFAYTYPELVDLNENTTLINRVNSLYGPNAHPFVKRGLYVAGAPLLESRRQYTVDIKIPLTSLNSSLDIYVFLGSPTGAVTQLWVDAQSFVGRTSMVDQNVQVSSSTETPKIYGNIPLTAALEARVRAGELEGMNEDIVGLYLKQNLQWQAVKVGTMNKFITQNVNLF